MARCSQEPPPNDASGTENLIFFAACDHKNKQDQGKHSKTIEMPWMKAVVMPAEQSVQEATENLGYETDDCADDAEDQAKRSTNQSKKHPKNPSPNPDTNRNRQ